MSFYVLAWIASFFYAFEAVVGKLTSKHSIKNPWLFNFVWAFFDLLLMFVLALHYHVRMPTHWGALLIASVFYTLGGTFYILGLYYFDISVFAPFFNLRSVFAVILSAIFLKEILTSHQYFIIAIIVLAGIFVTMDEKFSLKSFFRWPTLIILSEMLGLAFMGVFINKAIAVNGFWTVTLGLCVLTQIFLLATVPLFWKDRASISKKSWWPIFLMAFLGFIATLAANKSYASNVGISSTIIGLPLSMVVAFIFSRVAPDLLEKHSNKVYLVRFAAAAVMFIAALSLVH